MKFECVLIATSLTAALTLAPVSATTAVTNGLPRATTTEPSTNDLRNPLSGQVLTEDSLLTGPELAAAGLRGTYTSKSEIEYGDIYQDAGLKGLYVNPGQATFGFRNVGIFDYEFGKLALDRSAQINLTWNGTARPTARQACNTLAEGGESGASGKTVYTSARNCYIIDTSAPGISIAYVWTPGDNLTLMSRVSVFPNWDVDKGKPILSKRDIVKRAKRVVAAQYRKLARRGLG